jgi:hypothetical protein
MLNNRSVAFKISAIFLVGLAVCVISIGSLVNFHQYKIWGKPLIREFIGVKRENDKSVKTFQIQKESSGFSGLIYASACLDDGQPFDQNRPFQVSLISYHQGCTVIDQYLGFIAALRAPPAI